MTPNQITALRVMMALGAVAIFALPAPAAGRAAGLAAVGLTAAAVALDAVDGWVARRRKLETPLGAQLDILGDRVIENVYFTCFAVAGLISLWVPVVFFVRGTVTDFVRGLAGRAGHTGFGKNSMMETWWGRALVASRASRAAYGVMKCVCFCAVGLQLALTSADAATLAPFGAWLLGMIAISAQALVWLTVAFCVVRGLPVLWEGRRYVEALGAPAAQATRRTVALPRRSAA